MPQKYEREIDEIVSKGDDWGPRTPLRYLFRDALRRLRHQLAAELGRMFRWVTPTKVGVVGALLLIAGLVAKAPAIAILAVAVLLGAYLLAIVRGKGTFQETTGYDKSWRGRLVDSPLRSRWRDRFRRWFGRRS